MTQNQINYWALQETGRHNQATENETRRHNTVSEQVDLGTLAEAGRHNRATEGEQNRHNVAQERETNRSNLANESIRSMGNTIDLGRLTETQRHNVAQEGIDRQRNANVHEQNVESQRHNRVTESNQSYSAVSDRIRANADSALKQAQQRLTEIQGDWEAVQSANQVRLTNAQIEHYNQQNDEILRKMELMQSQIANEDLDAAWRTYEEILRGLGTAAEAARDVSQTVYNFRRRR